MSLAALGGCAASSGQTSLGLQTPEETFLVGALEQTAIRFLGDAAPSGTTTTATTTAHTGGTTFDQGDFPARRKDAAGLRIRHEQSLPLRGPVAATLGAGFGFGTRAYAMPNGARLDNGLLLADPIDLHFTVVDAEISGGLESDLPLHAAWQARVGAGVGIKAAHIRTKVRSNLLRIDESGSDHDTFVYLRADISPPVKKWRLDRVFVRGEARRYQSGGVSTWLGLGLTL